VAESITLSKRALNRALLARHMLLERERISPLHAIERLIALQAQQPRPPFIGLWTRVAAFKQEALLRLITERNAVRATMMRGTLHLASSKDYLAFRSSIQQALTAAMHSILKSRKSEFDIGAIVAAASRCFRERPQTFGELREALSKSFPDVDERAMGYAARTALALVMIPDDSEFGFGVDTKFALAESWLGKVVPAENRTQELVLRYLAISGPATVADAQNWSGLAGLKPVFEALRPKLRTFRDERRRELFDIPEGLLPGDDVAAPVRFLPAFDSAILSHADRSRIIADEHRARVSTKNLQVLPTFLVNGFVAGTWAFSRARRNATIEISPFSLLAAAIKQDVADEGEKLARFLAGDAVGFDVAFKTE
jgi:hypothetical protein